MPNNQSGSAVAGGKFNMSSATALTPERWVAVVVLGSLGILISVRMGFRGVNVLGARVSV